MNIINKKTTLAIVAITLFIISLVIFIYSKQSSDTDSTDKQSICAKYNDNSSRSGSCAKDAPSYCTVVYYPPMCKGCQDSRGCGYK